MTICELFARENDTIKKHMESEKMFLKWGNEVSNK